MKSWIMIVIVLFAGGLLSAFLFAGWGVSLNNREVSLRTSVEAKQLDNKQQLANMRNKFKETAQVSDKEADILTNVFVKYAQARSGQGGGSLVTMVTEAIPNVNPQTLRNLQNIIESGRNSWTARQTDLIDLNREHTQLLREFPGNILFGMLGRKEIQIIIITSDDAEKAFATGKEEQVDLFKK